jgi:hypothetical protein
VALLLALAGCAEQRPQHRYDPAPAPEPVPARVYVYPANNQSAAQLDRDRYECHLWAVKQSDFDPSAPHVAPHQRVQVVAMPPSGTSTVAGAATGAIVGAAVSRPGSEGSGAAVGAVAGAVLGAAADASREERAEQVQRRYDQRDADLLARLEQRSNDYRRAISACLEGRGYTVK